MRNSRSIVIPAKAGIQERPPCASGPPVHARGRRWTPAFAGVMENRRLLGVLVVKIAPSRVGTLDQLKLPSSSPFLDALFAQDGLNHSVVKLGIDEPVHPIPLGETVHYICSVLPNASAQVGCHSDVKRSVALAGNNVNTGSHVAGIMPWQS